MTALVLKRLRRSARPAALLLVAVWSLFPVYWALKTSFSTNLAAQSSPVQWFPLHPTVANYEAVFGRGPESQLAAGGITRALLNTVIETGSATILIVLISVMGAYSFARLRFRMRGPLLLVVIATLMLPAYATLIPIYRLMADLQLINTYFGIVLVFVSGFLPLAMWIMYNVFNVIPRSMEEAAVIDGASTLQTFVRVVLPVVLPGIAATAIVSFLFAWGGFLFPLVLSSGAASEPLTVVLSALNNRGNIPYTIINAAAIVTISIPVMIVIFLNRWIVTGITAGSSR